MNVRSILNVRSIFVVFLIIAILGSVASVSAADPQVNNEHVVDVAVGNNVFRGDVAVVDALCVDPITGGLIAAVISGFILIASHVDIGAIARAVGGVVRGAVNLLNNAPNANTTYFGDHPQELAEEPGIRNNDARIINESDINGTRNESDINGTRNETGSNNI